MSDMIFIAGWAHSGGAFKSLLSRLTSDSGGFIITSAAELDNNASGLIDLTESRAEPPVLIGWSMGAMLSIEAALSGAPVAGVVSIGGTAKFCSADDYPYGVPPPNLRALRRGLQRDFESVIRSFLIDAIAPVKASEAVLDALVADAAGIGMPKLTAGLDYLANRDLRAGLPRLSVPFLCVHGAEDEIIPSAASVLMAELALSPPPIIVAGAGHSLPAAVAGLLAGLIDDFRWRCVDD